MKNRIPARLAALAGLTGVGVGAAAVLLVAPAPAPQWAEPVTSLDSVLEVATQLYDGQETLTATPAVGVSRELRWPVAGVLTDSNCEPGGTLTSGDRVFTVDNQPVIALHTQTPLWREIGPGMRGADVAAVQTELNNLGADLQVTGEFGPLTAAAVRNLWRDAGRSPDDSWVRLSQIVWLPEREVTVSECHAQVGDRVETGGAAATIGGTLNSLTVRIPVGDESAPRIAFIPGTDIVTPIPGDGLITDQAFLSRYFLTHAFSQYLSGAVSEVPISTQLVEPINVIAVPASALYDVVGSAGCVIGDGQPKEVSIIASQFGQTLVTSDPLPSSVAVTTADAAPCR